MRHKQWERKLAKDKNLDVCLYLEGVGLCFLVHCVYSLQILKLSPVL